jgi:hypothetical protein
MIWSNGPTVRRTEMVKQTTAKKGDHKAAPLHGRRIAARGANRRGLKRGGLKRCGLNETPQRSEKRSKQSNRSERPPSTASKGLPAAAAGPAGRPPAGQSDIGRRPSAGDPVLRPTGRRMPPGWPPAECHRTNVSGRPSIIGRPGTGRAPAARVLPGYSHPAEESHANLLCEADL